MQGTPLADDGRDTSEESNNPTLYMAQAAELPLAGQLTPPDKLALEQAGGPSWGQANAAGGTPAAGGNTPQNVVMDMDDEPPPKKKRGCLIFIIIVLILIVLLLAGSTVAYFVIGVDRIYEMAGMSTTDTPVVALPDGGVYAIPTLPDGGTIAIPTVPGVPTPLVPGVAIPVPTLGDAAVAIPPVGDAAVALATGDAAAAPAEADAGAPPAETPPAETPPAETPPAETPPAETPPVETPPAETPPTEATDDGQPRTPERYISRAQSRLRRVGRPCLGRSSASGRVTLTVSLLQNGTVSRASVSGNSTGDSNLGRCLSGAVLNQRLGIPPRGTHSFQVTFSR